MSVVWPLRPRHLLLSFLHFPVAITVIRKILNEDSKVMNEQTLPDKGLQRCIFILMAGGFVNERDTVNVIKLNFTNRRLVAPETLGLPDVIKISSVPCLLKNV